MPKTINAGAEDVAVSRLKPHPRNANQGDFGAIQQSIERNGFFGRIVANRRTGHILVGNHRWQVARQMGFETVPVEWVDVDAEAELRILLADNRTARLGIDDEAKLAELLAELVNTPLGLEGTGFDGDDLDRLIADLADSPAPPRRTPRDEGLAVIVDCKSAEEQDRVQEKLSRLGLLARRATVSLKIDLRDA